jgi:hemerythrin-like domain-containing protein
MRALDSLRRDHQLLFGLTEALDAYANAMDAEQPLVAGDFAALVQGFRTFADYRHFEKEEQILGPWLVRHGFDDNLPILVDGRDEHHKLRYLIDVLYQSAQRELDWTKDERKRISAAAHSLCERQRRLAAQQEIELFPDIITRIAGSHLEELASELWQFDVRSEAKSSALDAQELSRDVFGRYAGLGPSRARGAVKGSRSSRSARARAARAAEAERSTAGIQRPERYAT